MKRPILAIALTLTLAACSHQKAVEQKVDQEVSAQPAVPMGGPMAAESRKLISESSELTQEQKDKLLALHTRMAGKVAKIREEEGKLKMVFFRAMLNPKAEDAEINTLKNRILKLDRQKTTGMLSAFEEVRQILGRKPLRDERILRAFEMEQTGRIGRD